MKTFIKSLRKVLEVDTRSPKETSISQTSSYQRLINSKSASDVTEKSKGDFEKNSLEENSKFLIEDDNNPLVYGLKNLDRFSMVISDKSFSGVMTFVDKPFVSTPTYFKDCSLDQARDIVLKNLGVYDAVKSGAQKSLPQATAFNILSLTLAREIRLGKRVYATYYQSVVSLGERVIKEWSHNGSS